VTSAGGGGDAGRRESWVNYFLVGRKLFGGGGGGEVRELTVTDRRARLGERQRGAGGAI